MAYLCEPLRILRRGDLRRRRLEVFVDVQLPEIVRLIVRYLAAAIVGLLVGAYVCLGVLILLVPEMRSETSLWFVMPAGLIGAVGGALLVRRRHARRMART